MSNEFNRYLKVIGIILIFIVFIGLTISMALAVDIGTGTKLNISYTYGDKLIVTINDGTKYTYSVNTSFTDTVQYNWTVSQNQSCDSIYSMFKDPMKSDVETIVDSSFADMESWFKFTFMPEREKIDNCTRDLSIARTEIESYKLMLENKQEQFRVCNETERKVIWDSLDQCNKDKRYYGLAFLIALIVIGISLYIMYGSGKIADFKRDRTMNKPLFKRD